MLFGWAQCQAPPRHPAAIPTWELPTVRTNGHGAAEGAQGSAESRVQPHAKPAGEPREHHPARACSPGAAASTAGGTQHPGAVCTPAPSAVAPAPWCCSCEHSGARSPPPPQHDVGSSCKAGAELEERVHGVLEGEGLIAALPVSQHHAGIAAHPRRRGRAARLCPQHPPPKRGLARGEGRWGGGEPGTGGSGEMGAAGWGRVLLPVPLWGAVAGVWGACGSPTQRGCSRGWALLIHAGSRLHTPSRAQGSGPSSLERREHAGEGLNACPPR